MSEVSIGRKVIAGLFEAFLSVILFSVGMTIILGFSGLASSGDIKETAARTDCRSEYNARLLEVKDQRLTLISQVVTASVAGDTARVKILGDDLADLVVQIDTLPRLDLAVDRGFTLNGVRYPPCPG